MKAIFSNKSVFFLFCTIFLAGNVALAQDVPSDFFVLLSKSECEADCPVYSVSVNADGEVEYKGISSVETIGAQTAVVDRGVVRKLYREIEGNNYFSLDQSLCTSDNKPSVYLTVRLNGATKSLRDDSCDEVSDSVKLRGINSQIDSLLVTSRWTNR
jgi:hypothetical protein